MEQMCKKLSLIVTAFAVAGCQGIAPVLPMAPPQTQSYVSATSAGDEDAAYVAALEEAQNEYAREEQAVNDVVAAALPETTLPATGDLWARPLTSAGQGVTLKNEDTRRRLNDALDTTPLGGSARWEAEPLKFLFLPNSPVYTPHQSGGRCRDGVFAVYGDGFNDQRIRGLFCQTGPGADWLLKMQVVE